MISGNQRGMTVLEIAVGTAFVLAVGVLFLWIFQGLRANGRDVQREQDIKQLQNALDIYITSRGLFPVCDETVVNGNDDCLTSTLKKSGTLLGSPVDPLGGAVGSCDDAKSHVYCYSSLDGFSYVLKYNLETDNIAGKRAGWKEVHP